MVENVGKNQRAGAPVTSQTSGRPHSWSTPFAPGPRVSAVLGVQPRSVFTVTLCGKALSQTHFQEEKTEAPKGRSHLPPVSQHLHKVCLCTVHLAGT